MTTSNVVAESNRRRRRDLTGKTFGRLAVLGPSPNQNGRTAWRCRCTCGSERVVLTQNLTGGKTVSCGCFGREATAARATHGHCRTMGGTPEYRAWRDMMRRCHDRSNKRYADYGGRGITVCDEWQASFAAFLAAVGPRPGPGYSLDRRENDKGYSPENCRWTTAKRQQRNMRSNRLVTHGGETLPVSEWAERTGLRWHTIASRLDRGWSAEHALSVPAKKYQKVYFQGRRSVVA